MQSKTGYVVYGCERLRDGVEEWAKCFDTLEQALAHINENAAFFCGRNMRFDLFRLGTPIPLEAVLIEEPQPARVKTVFKVKE